MVLVYFYVYLNIINYNNINVGYKNGVRRINRIAVEKFPGELNVFFYKKKKKHIHTHFPQKKNIKRINELFPGGIVK